MREILFRGKSKNINEYAQKDDGRIMSYWVYGGIVHQTDFYGDKCDRWFIIDGTDTQDYDIGYEYEVIPETVGQFTGLHDRTGKRIFEGDFVKDLFNDLICCVEYGNYFDGFSENLFYLKCGSVNFLIKNDMDLEVIGNIFDNPELLEVE